MGAWGRLFKCFTAPAVVEPQQSVLPSAVYAPSAAATAQVEALQPSVSSDGTVAMVPSQQEEPLLGPPGSAAVVTPVAAEVELGHNDALQQDVQQPPQGPATETDRIVRGLGNELSPSEVDEGQPRLVSSVPCSLGSEAPPNRRFLTRQAHSLQSRFGPASDSPSQQFRNLTDDGSNKVCTLPVSILTAYTGSTKASTLTNLQNNLNVLTVNVPGSKVRGYRAHTGPSLSSVCSGTNYFNSPVHSRQGASAWHAWNPLLAGFADELSNLAGSSGAGSGSLAGSVKHGLANFWTDVSDVKFEACSSWDPGSLHSVLQPKITSGYSIRSGALSHNSNVMAVASCASNATDLTCPPAPLVYKRGPVDTSGKLPGSSAGLSNVLWGPSGWNMHPLQGRHYATRSTEGPSCLFHSSVNSGATSVDSSALPVFAGGNLLRLGSSECPVDICSRANSNSTTKRAVEV